MKKQKGYWELFVNGKLFTFRSKQKAKWFLGSYKTLPHTLLYVRFKKK